MSFHLSLFKMVGLHYMPFFACHDCKDNTSSAAGLKIYRIQLSGDELRLVIRVALRERGAPENSDESATTGPPAQHDWFGSYGQLEQTGVRTS